ncbi:MAG: hypothetical protein M3680_02900 [Myxococcota bacterium]|nr:hypothetical protein [Myxococcota bacterium]
MPIDSDVSVASSHSQVLKSASTGGGFGTAELGAQRDVFSGAIVDFVKRTDPRESTLGLGMIGLGLLKLSEHVRPTAGKYNTRAGASTGAVGTCQRV